jgi:hypothetical protein
MHNPETGKTADVHPNEVDNWKAVGWREVKAALAPSLPPPPAPAKPQLGLPGKGK